MALRVLARDGNGRLLFDGKRFASVSGAEAKTQLLRERVALQVGADRFRPLRGVDYDGLKQARATPQAFASAVAAELILDPKVSSATAAPRGVGTTRTPINQTALIDARVVLRADATIVNLEVPFV
jgi:hypothetical protein